MNNYELIYTLQELSIIATKILKIPNIKIVSDDITNDIDCNSTTNQININNNYLLNIENNTNDFMIKFFSEIYYNYCHFVCNGNYNYEDDETIKCWKNDFIKKVMFDNIELDVDISAKAFSFFIIEKIFGTKQHINNLKIIEKIQYFKEKYH